MFCDLTFLEGVQANTNDSDHFYKNVFDKYTYTLITDDGIKPFSDYINDLSANQNELNDLFKYFDGLSPNENRKRWDRFHLFHLTILIFLNTYGYDFQRTNYKKLKEIITVPKKSNYLENYFKLLDDYHLKNKHVKKIKCVAEIKKKFCFYN